MKTLGIYVQVPFCQTRCTYCNFHTGVVAAERFGPYVDGVCAEIRGHGELYAKAGVEWGSGEWRVASGENRKTEDVEFAVDTVYIGGGTPSLLEPGLLAAILEAIRETFSTEQSELTEVTLEADPETVTEEKAAAWVDAGINRVSFGVQSFVDKELVAAGRMHRREDVYRAVPILRAAGIGNISFDLIAGLPHQTKESWRRSLEELVRLAPEHVSVYLLEVDEGSRLGKEVLDGGKRYSAGALPTEDEMAEFYEEAQRVLGEAGYHHYEISNWAKPGFESRHNLKYWRREAYLGFGAGAHSFSGKQRWANVHDAAEFVRGIEDGLGKPSPLQMAGRKGVIEQLETVGREQALGEELFLGLRQLDGIDLRRIEEEYGVGLGGRLERLETAGLVERRGDWVRLAEGKLSVSNEVFVELMK
jgi:oxygen-independent coproporphyrinogen-3 oxidase